jgi:hypothetical protein
VSEAAPAPLDTSGAPVVPTSTITDPPTFRSHFPEFADTTVYPDTQVQFYIDLNSAVLPAYRWGSMLQAGVELMTAHELALSQRALQAGASGGIPGGAGGLMTNKSVSKVSVGYDVNITGIEGGGPWNYTIYGQRFYWLMRMVGIGGYEVLSDSAGDNLSGVVLTWLTGVMYRWGS